MWQDPMDDSQQTETRRRILNILDALISELTSRGLNVIRRDENTLVVNGMELSATDQLSDTYNDVCYLLTDYNQMIDCTLSRIEECADTIEELLEVQVEKMGFTDMVKSFRNKGRLIKTDHSRFEIGTWYYANVTNKNEGDYGYSYEVNVRIIDRDGDYIVCDDEYGETHRCKLKTTEIMGEQVESFKIKELDNAVFYSSYISS